MEFSSPVGFFLAVMIALSMMLQMQTPAAAISCDPVETSLMSRSSADNCRKDLQNLCVSQGREASKSEFSSFPTNQDKIKCEGCCQVPLPTSPPPPPAPRCFDSCETKCGAIGVRAADQACVRLVGIKTRTFKGLACTCCCRARIVLPPTPPLPLTPTSDNNICKLEDIHLAFKPSDSPGCRSCPADCESKCTALGTSVVQEQCTQGSDSSRCKCCCRDNTSPPPPSPPPSPLALPPIIFDPLPPPPPSNNNMCKVGDKYAEIRSFETTSCRFCETDCETRCSRDRTRMTMQMCTVETKSVFCKCCCAAA
ncbi:hypothetical protein MKW98_001501 [Papaver atlanticum]|uniref:Uncharacterized protein n=1 Tax=Papaver atlanticum TaxID=357466 RepID=A0AAD4SVI9_9MAGN|nr:hypothetical protein MKW98_001501 [Papaver atlanticum]